MADSVKSLIPATSLVEISLTNGTFNYTFGRQEKVQDRDILGIIVSQAGDKATTNADIADPADAYIYLKEARSNDIVHEIPARNFLFTPGIPALQLMEMDARRIDWEKSELRFSPGATIVTGEVFQMTVVYDR